MERRLEHDSMLRLTSHIADPPNLAHHKAKVPLLRESLARAGVEVAGDGEIKGLDITGLDTLHQDDLASPSPPALPGDTH